MGDFTPISPAESEQQGMNALQSFTDNWRKNQAMDAYVKQYGPMAGDIATGQKLQDYQQNALTNPIAVQQAQANLAGKQADTAQTTLATTDQQNADLRAAQVRALTLLKGSADANGNIDPKAIDQIVGPDADMLGLSGDRYAAFKAKHSAPGAGNNIDQEIQGMLAPQQVGSGAPIQIKKADGTGAVLRFDKNGNPMYTDLPTGAETTTQQRVDTGNTNAITRRAGESVQDFRARVYAANQANLPVGGAAPANQPDQAPFTAQATPLAPGVVPPPGQTRSGMTTQQLDAIIKKAPSIDAAIKLAKNDQMAADIMDRYEQTHNLGPDAKGAAAAQPDVLARWPVGSAARSNVLAGASAVEALGTNFDNANVVTNQVKAQLAPYTTGVGSVLIKNLPGTVQNDLRHNLQTLTTQAATGNLSAQKNAKGSTGYGRILQSEWNAFGQMSGNMAQDQTVGQLMTHLNMLQDTLANGYARTSGAYKSEYQVDSRAALGMGQAPSRQAPVQRITSNADWAALPKGTQYMAPDGKMRTKNFNGSGP